MISVPHLMVKQFQRGEVCYVEICIYAKLRSLEKEEGQGVRMDEVDWAFEFPMEFRTVLNYIHHLERLGWIRKEYAKEGHRTLERLIPAIPKEDEDEDHSLDVESVEREEVEYQSSLAM